MRNYNNCLDETDGIDYVFHIAGVKTSPAVTFSRPYTMSIPPLMVNTNILEACRVNNVRKTLFTSSIGAYAQAEVLEEINAYKGEPMDFLPGHVKRMTEYQIQGYAQEYKENRFVIVRLANCYGPGDNFDPASGMVVSSLIAKFCSGNPVKVWGDGSARRDLLYSEDAAKGILLVMENVDNSWPVNLGSGTEHSIKEVADCLSKMLEIPYEFDTSKPSGVARRYLDISCARSFGYNPQTSLAEGLLKTWVWFTKHPKEYEKRQNYFSSR